MAKGDKEHRMLFDLRGKRRNVVKVVYATLAVLMGLSLFIVIGGFNIAELFNNTGSSGGNAAEPYEEQAERIEAKLKKDPQDTNLMISLTRAQVNAGNAGVELQENGGRTYPLEALQRYQEAAETWSDYLKATDEPSAGIAQVVAPALLTLAELARTYPQSIANLEAAVEAQEIVAEQRPNLNSYTTLALYTYFTGDFDAAEEARREAKKLAQTETERDAIDKQLDEAKKRAETFQKEVAQAKKQTRKLRQEEAARGGAEGGAGSEGFEAGGPLSEALGGGSQLTE